MEILRGLLERGHDWLQAMLLWVESFAATPYGGMALFILSFAESSFFPIPPDVLLIALCLGEPESWIWFATICQEPLCLVL